MRKDKTPSRIRLPEPRGAERQATRLEELGERASAYIDGAKAENTRRSYRSDWADFTAWCEKYRRQSMPALPDSQAH